MSLYEKTKAKEILVNEKEIKQLVQETIQSMANLVGSTMGPAGRTVLIERDGMSPLVTKDGVTVAKSIGYQNSTQNVLAEAAKEICLNTGKEVGDGTTSAVVLADALIKNGNDYLDKNNNENPQAVTRELLRVYHEIIIPEIQMYSKKTETEKELVNVARISANGDDEVANVTVAAVMTAGEDGSIVITEDLGGALRCETIDGYIVTSGLKNLGAIGTIFINDRSKQAVKLDNGIVFLYNAEINDAGVIANIQECINNNRQLLKPVLLFAHNFSDTVLEALSKNFKSGYLPIIPIKTPHTPVPTSKVMFLYDMSAYTGATVLDPGTINSLAPEHFGEFLNVTINLYECLLTCDVDMDMIKERVDQLKAIHEAAPSDYDKSFIKAEIGKLLGGISTIFVGGLSELEIRERKARVEDAVEAVRSAIAEGVVPGGASMYLAMAKYLEQHPDKKPCWDIIIKSLPALINKILYNSGEAQLDSIIKYIYNNIDINNKEISTIFNINTKIFQPPFDSGIIEPAKVIRVVIANALSVANMLITLGGVVVVPRDITLETQLDMQKDAFRNIMGSLNNA